MRKLLSTILLVLILLVAFAAEVAAVPESREYKIMLDPGKFESVRNGCELFLELVKNVAADHGFSIKEKNKPISGRQICFIDTPDFDLNKRGFLLRIRTERIDLSTDSSDLQMAGDAEMTLKYRAAASETAQHALVEPAKAYGEDISEEADVVASMATTVTFYSRSGKVADFIALPESVKDLWRYYPQMKMAGLNADQKLKMVNDVVVVEQQVQHGSIDFGHGKAKSVFSVWLEKRDKKILAVEFSFKIKNRPYLLQTTEGGQNRIDQFFIDLVKRGKLFVSSDQTKTAIVYQQLTTD